MRISELVRTLIEFVLLANVVCQSQSRVTRYGVVKFRETSKPFILQFDFLGEDYIIFLERNHAIFHRNFKVVTSDGHVTHRNEEYVGHVKEPQNGKAVLSRLDKNRYIGNLYFHNDTLHIEPADHLNSSADPNLTIGYFGSDTNITLDLSSLPHRNAVSYRPPNPLTRFRRNVEPISFTSAVANEKKNRCPLKIVADFSFFNTTGKKNIGVVTKYIVNMVARLNEIYTRVNWDEGKEDSIRSRGKFVNMGFSIKEIQVLDKRSRKSFHYNTYSQDWSPAELLTKFAKEEASDEFCIVHLLTARSFKSVSTLGLAYMANRRWEEGPGGICSLKETLNGQQVYYNAVMTTVLTPDTPYYYPLITKEIDIVVAHEYGHAWGAPHDPDVLLNDQDVAQCSPSFGDGGKYIMYYMAQKGYDTNNVYFSPCSRRMIREVLNLKWHACFEEEKTSYCGNGFVEDDEECDNGNEWQDKCCTEDCKLAVGAKCCPVNQICCTKECQYHNSSHVCLEGDDLLCKTSAYCSGFSGDCPPAPPVENGQTCIEDGECFEGTCLPFCEKASIGKKSCICEEVELSCHRCCLNNGTCAPEPGVPDLPDGTKCSKGYCKNNKCVIQAVDEVNQLFHQPFRDSETIKDNIKKHLVVFVVFVVTASYCIIAVLVKLRKKMYPESESESDEGYRKVVVTPQ